MLKNNMFSHDTDGERLERLLALSLNIDTHAATLGVSGARLAVCQTAGADWSGACVVAGVENGEAQEATQTLNTALKAAHTYYVAAKEVLQPILDELEKDDKIVEEYAIKGDAPWDFKGLEHKIGRWVETDARLKALVPPDPRVVNDTIVAELAAQLANIKTLWHNARVQEQEASDAYAAKRALFDKHSAILRILFGIAKMTWGADSQKLKDLGIVPSSEVWTEGGGTSGEIGVPENLVATLEGEDVRIAWDAVADADEYQLVHTQYPPMFLEIYAGEDTGFLHLKPDNGTHYYNVRAKRGDEYGAYGTPVSVEVVVAPPAPPVNLSIVQVGSDTKITWEAPPGVFYDGCSLFVADAPTGGGTPPLPAEPMFHDLFVYSLTLSAPAPGMTRFVWVTGVKNGATSDPAGPASVDIV